MNRRHFLRNGLWILLLLPMACFGQVYVKGKAYVKGASYAGTIGASGGGGGCSTLSETWGTGTSLLSTRFGANAGEKYEASVWIASNSVANCKLVLTNLVLNGNGGGGNITFQIWSDSGANKPGSDLTSGGVTVAATSIVSGQQTINLTMSSKTSGSHYWTVMFVSVTGDASNCFHIDTDSDEPYLGFSMEVNSPDGTTWSAVDAQGAIRQALFHN